MRTSTTAKCERVIVIIVINRARADCFNRIFFVSTSVECELSYVRILSIVVSQLDD